MVNIYKLKSETKAVYNSFGSVYCPVLKANVVFNNHGWTHLSFDGKGHRRFPADIILRHRLVIFAPDVIKLAKVLIEPLNPDNKKIVKIKNIERKIEFFEIAHEVDGKKRHVTVILRKIEQGKLHFYSVRRTRDKIKKALIGLN